MAGNSIFLKLISKFLRNHIFSLQIDKSNFSNYKLSYFTEFRNDF